ncbi:calcium-independent phospholipase A2-gamma-like [Cololabis saira]|uniref:calcium-independent phospholipase A2-gamma-like n=1 Tax=Cololabis saira TaxID=129043 RepID=UPI002AD40FB2|nr:calcium-independent phospholipase A2-gamma-like [Cololabis saira]
MGRLLITALCANPRKRTLKSYCRVRYTVSLLRRYRSLARAPLCRDSCRHSQLQPPQRLRFASSLDNAKHNNTSFFSSSCSRDFTKEATHFHTVRFSSSSNRDAFKAEAPAGISDEALNIFQWRSLGGRLGQSFTQLSRHINMYLKRKNVVGFAENAPFVVAAPEYLGQSQGPRPSQQTATDQTLCESKGKSQALKCKGKQETSDISSSTQEMSGLQLFHISALATRFGESYSYVANNINSMFSQGYATDQHQDNFENLSSDRGTGRRLRRRIAKNSVELSDVKLNNKQSSVEPKNIPSSWEEGYLQIARHINKYFGAKVTDEAQNKTEELPREAHNTYERHLSTQSTSQAHSGRSQQQQEKPFIQGSVGLFHSSPNTTKFGENYFQTSSHINQYFKSESQLDEDNDLQTGIVPKHFSNPSLMDCLRHPTSAIPDLLGSVLRMDSSSSRTTRPKKAGTSPQAILNKKLVMGRRQAEEATQGLIFGLGLASSAEDVTACVNVLNEHLIRYPSCKALIWQEKAVVTLLRLRRTYRYDQTVQAALRQAFALVGFVGPVKGQGIRVLSIDGGGTRGVVPLQLLKLLEDETGKKIHQLFDYICGVSTGAVLAFMLGLARFSLEECADMYRQFGCEVFRQNRLVGTMKMGWSHSYYNTETWEKILQEKLGKTILIKTSRDVLSPKVSAVSAVVNWGTSPKAFVFRNYNHKPGVLSRYAGASGCQMWEAVRASSAAPGYFQEFPFQSDIHQDGGIILNNPCALAVHESRLLWPKQPFQCVLSLGTGRYDNARRGPATSTSLRAKISNLISSATDTEGVHTLLDELLASDVYFRFNPMLSAEVPLDENRPEVLDQLQRDTQNYLERNRPKLAKLCLVLGAERSSAGRAKDWMSEKVWEMRQRLT